MILFLHNRYRISGGEERSVRDLLWLVREQLGEPASLLERGEASRTEAALGMLRGGVDPAQVERAVRSTGARVLHAHNLNPTLGWRSLAAAREAGARVVLHLHQYRLVCAVGVCFTQGEECTRCHGRSTLPGVLRNCRGSRAEALVYAAGLSAWQSQLLAQVDELVVPSEFARTRLVELGIERASTAHVLPNIVREFAVGSRAAAGSYALLVCRLAPEKGIEAAIEACRIAGLELVVAGDGPMPRLAGARYVGALDAAALAELRAGASLALVPSRSAETFGLAAAEAMAAGLPVAGSRIGALGELLPDEWLAPPGDARALAAVAGRLAGDPAAGERALALARERVAPEVAASALRAIYA
ncbi:MAG: glycosyltransferase family 4 protein [Solirubrobacteraceae bacterium]